MAMNYPVGSCVLVYAELAWPDDNGRQRGEPEGIEGPLVGYLVRQRRDVSQIFFIGQRRLYWVPNEGWEPFDPLQTGDDFDMKICLTCGLLKLTEEFAFNQIRADGVRVRRPRCQPCFVRDSGRQMSSRVRDRYLEEHGPAAGDAWQCPVCEKVSVAYVNVKIVVDHDQETGQPRGLICDSCNTGLGRFKNGENHLHNAIEYLQGR